MKEKLFKLVLPWLIAAVALPLVTSPLYDTKPAYA